VQLQRGRVAVITGAAGGIGLALAQGLARSGLHVVVSDLQAEQVEAATQSIRDAGGAATSVVADVSRPADIERLSEAAWSAGSVQVVCSNAGIVRNGPAWSVSDEDWEQVIDVNLMASVHLVRAFVPRLIEQGKPAHMLFTGSMGSVTARAGNAPYTVAKHGLLALAESLQLDLAAGGHPVGVTLLMPGLVATPMTGSFAAGNPEAISAEEAADVALGAIAGDRLFAFTQPDRLESVRARFAAIVGSS
jgi:NAD(P)-dependent dehydrogenase (short-subunit alcohol dehydrogenase family)